MVSLFPTNQSEHLLKSLNSRFSKTKRVRTFLVGTEGWRRSVPLHLKYRIHKTNETTSLKILGEVSGTSIERKPHSFHRACLGRGFVASQPGVATVGNIIIYLFISQLHIIYCNVAPKNHYWLITVLTFTSH